MIKNALKFNLRESNFSKFSGGACPQTPLALACFTRMCALHTINAFPTI